MSGLREVLRVLCQSHMKRFSMSEYDGPIGTTGGYSVRHSGRRFDLTYAGAPSDERMAEFIPHLELALREEIASRPGWTWSIEIGIDGRYLAHVMPHVLQGAAGYGDTAPEALAAALFKTEARLAALP